MSPACGLRDIPAAAIRLGSLHIVATSQLYRVSCGCRALTASAADTTDTAPNRRGDKMDEFTQADAFALKAGKLFSAKVEPSPSYS
jgi:hypothetical protein